MSSLETPGEPVLPTKLLADLDDLVQALRKSLPLSTVWQRQLHLHLDDMDRGIQILRLTVAMQRGAGEHNDAVLAVLKPARAANAYVAMGRADMGTKAAVRLTFEMSRQLAKVSSISM
ncbi:MAG: hypothetical protein EOO80_00655 [Oxalobacteraceae bacterium]|nr:MAG: hypothetical protein EOO80_00655 [Oxalobacteraceae bacterium]